MKPIIIYHRGRHGVISDQLTLKENTLPAIERAVQEGAEIIEIDVWSDLRVIHDPVVADAPTVPEMLKLIDGQCSLNIEIKSPKVAPSIISLVQETLAAGRWRKEQIILSSFHHKTALFCKRELPDVTVHAICDGVLLDSYIETLSEGGISKLQLHWANIFMDIEDNYKMRNTLRRLGMEIWVWTVNSPAIFKTVCEYGVQGVFTDTPDLFR